MNKIQTQFDIRSRSTEETSRTNRTVSSSCQKYSPDKWFQILDRI